jgi:hypothetical protein
LAIKELKAVEPSEGMRGKFSESVLDQRVSVSEGTFDKTGAEDGWADLVVVAQVCSDLVSREVTMYRLFHALYF